MNEFHRFSTIYYGTKGKILHRGSGNGNVSGNVVDTGANIGKGKASQGETGADLMGTVHGSAAHASGGRFAREPVNNPFYTPILRSS